MQLGITELIVIFVVILFVVGPDRLPGYAKKMGEAVSQFRKYSKEATREIKESLVEPLEDLNKAVRADVQEIRDSLEGVGKPKKTAPPPEEPDQEPDPPAGDEPSLETPA